MKFLSQVLIVSVLTTSVSADRKIKNEKVLLESARAFVKVLLKLEKNYDPRIAEYYDSDAEVTITRIYPDGLRKSKLFTGKQMRNYLDKHVMRYKKECGDRAQYSKITYTALSEYRVRVTMLRKQFKKKTAHPYSLIIGPDKNNKWKIFKENVIEEPF